MTIRGIWLLLLLLTSTPVSAADIRLNSSALGSVFIEGEPVAFSVRADADNVTWKIQNFFGTEAASGTLSLTNGVAVLTPRLRGMGYYTLELEAERGRAQSGILQTALAIVPRPHPFLGNSPFGVVTHFAKGWPTDIIPLIEKAGIHRIRDEQPWRKIEKQPGQYEFPAQLKTYMSELAARHIDPLIVLAFSNPLYDGDQTPYTDEGRSGYAAYARAVALQYAHQNPSVEIWNEYNGSFCEGPCQSNRPAYYTRMLKQAYETLKSANPNLVVAGGAAVPIPLDYFRGLFKNGALDAMDAVVIHPYRKQPEGVEDKIDALRQLMQSYGKAKPIWATEFSDLPDMRKNRDDVARYLVRMSALLLSAKVERIYWYLLKDYGEFSGLGLLRNENDPQGPYVATPAYAAYATLIDQLDGMQFVRREASTPEARVYLFSDGRKNVRVAWSTSLGTTYTLQPEGTVHEIDMMGNPKDMPANAGGISITLDQNPIYLVTPANAP